MCIAQEREGTNNVYGVLCALPVHAGVIRAMAIVKADGKTMGKCNLNQICMELWIIHNHTYTYIYIDITYNIYIYIYICISSLHIHIYIYNPLHIYIYLNIHIFNVT